ncbi:MAG: thiolase family protein [Myxococcales bacterium]|nr:thiolase family protein [Myxococcales bacterium]
MTKKPLSRAIYIVAAKRTAFGTFGGALKDMSATDLGVVAAKAALTAGGVDPSIVDAVCFGNVAQTSADAIYMARHVGLRSGVPIEVPALTVNRLCGSGFQAVVSGAQDILTDEAEIVLTGGAESMSQAPYAARNVRWGTRLGSDIKLEDTLWSSLTDSYTGCAMAITAENLAEKYSISREECDEYGLRSQQTWAAAQEAGRFAAEIAPIELKTRKGVTSFEVDEHARPTATLEGMAKLPAVFKKGGVVTAGNASGICDGAGALIVASEEAVKRHNLTPLARLVAWHVSGVDPTIMGIGPVPAIRGVLERGGLGLDAIDLVEINEAFAVVSLVNQDRLGIASDRLNVRGGAVALGHPIGASGCRILITLIHALKQTGKHRGVASLCIGGGEAVALMVER